MHVGWHILIWVLAVLVLPAIFVFYDAPFRHASDRWCSERGMPVKRIHGTVLCVESDTRRLLLPPD
jgi:hypothetical protein